MVVVLCDSYRAASDAFSVFMRILSYYDPWTIRVVNEAALYVETDEDLRYIFCDYRMSKLFEDSTLDILEESEFFEGLEECYGLE